MEEGSTSVQWVEEYGRVGQQLRRAQCSCASGLACRASYEEDIGGSIDVSALALGCVATSKQPQLRHEDARWPQDDDENFCQATGK